MFLIKYPHHAFSINLQSTAHKETKLIHSLSLWALVKDSFISNEYVTCLKTPNVITDLWSIYSLPLCFTTHFTVGSVIRMDFMTNTGTIAAAVVEFIVAALRWDWHEAGGLWIVLGLSQQFTLRVVRNCCWSMLGYWGVCCLNEPNIKV